MEKEIAIELLKEWRKLLDIVNKTMEQVDRIQSEEDRKVMMRHVASLAVACEEHLLTPVLAKHPDLDPF